MANGSNDVRQNWSDEYEAARYRALEHIHEVRCERTVDEANSSISLVDQDRSPANVEDRIRDVEKVCDGVSPAPSDDLKHRTATAFDKTAASVFGAGDYTACMNFLNSSDRYERPNKERLSLRAKATRVWEREEEKITAREGPVWHIEAVCSGVLVTGSWKRGKSVQVVKKSLCENAPAPLRAECMAGPTTPNCTVTFTKARCEGCDSSR